MSHEIEEVDGVAQMAYVGEVPWHGLGTRVSPDLSPAEIQIAAGLDWQVRKEPLYLKSGDDLVKTEKEALIRSSDDSILTYVGKGWKPVQNDEAFNFFTDFIEAGDMEMHTAGSLKNGQIVWALAKLKDSFCLANNDEVESYLLFSNPHQFGKAVSVGLTSVRVVCNNTLNFALNRASDKMVTSNHRSIFSADLAKETLGIASYKMDEFRQLAEFLSTRKTKQTDVVEYFKKVFPSLSAKNDNNEHISRNAKLALEALETQPGAELSEGTWWSCLNASTFLIDHTLGRSQDTRLTSAWFGTGANTKIKALHLAKEFAHVA